MDRSIQQQRHPDRPRLRVGLPHRRHTLIAVRLWRVSLFGNVLSITGMLCITLLFGFNRTAVPDPPISISLLDKGPFCVLWMLAVCGWMLRPRTR